jgi:hypothetical protein
MLARQELAAAARSVTAKLKTMLGTEIILFKRRAPWSRLREHVCTAPGSPGLALNLQSGEEVAEAIGSSWQVEVPPADKTMPPARVCFTELSKSR